MSEIALSAGIRSSLFSLQNTMELLGETTKKLSTGKKVNSPLDDPSAFFNAANLNDRADGLSRRLDAMGQAVSTIQTADASVKGIRDIVANLKSKIDEALTTIDSNKRADLGVQFNELLLQTHTMAKDASYQGVNLVQGSEELTVQFNESFNESTLTVQGFDLVGPTTKNGSGVPDANLVVTTSSGVTITVEKAIYDGTGSTPGTEIDWSGSDYKDVLSSLTGQLEEIDEALVNESKSLNTAMSVVSIREDFTKQEINLFRGGADKLTLADMNEEGANLLALQTSQQLGVQSLALASSASQAILRLLG